MRFRRPGLTPGRVILAYLVALLLVLSHEAGRLADWLTDLGRAGEGPSRTLALNVAADLKAGARRAGIITLGEKEDQFFLALTPQLEVGALRGSPGPRKSYTDLAGLSAPNVWPEPLGPDLPLLNGSMGLPPTSPPVGSGSNGSLESLDSNLPPADGAKVESIPLNAAPQKPIYKNVLLIGDSMMLEGLGPPLQKALKNVVGLEVSREGRYATGLCRLDVFDWFSYFEEMIAAKEPDLVIITIGANDTQDIVDENGRHLVTTDSWREIYGQRVKTLLAIAAQSKVEVAWIGLPIMGQETYNQRTIAINEVAAQACAEASNCRFFDSWDILADKGQYSTFLTINQKRQRVRAKDLIHLTEAGGRILAEAFLNDTQSWAILGQDPNSPLAESDLPAAPVVLNPNAPPIRLVSAPIPIDGPNPPENRTIIDDPALVPNKLVPPAPVIFGPSQIDNLKADNLTKVAPTGSHNLTTNPNPLANLTINPPPMVYPDPKEAAALVEATLESRLLGRTVNYLVYTPKTQGPLPAVLLLPGVGENYKAFVSHFGEDLFKQAIANGLILIMIDSGEDGWYLDSPILKRSKYQSHILDELIPDALEKFPIQKEKLAISGISMGGHGALTLALKSPTRFQAVSSFSGVTDLTVHGDNHPINRFLGLEKVLGPYKRHTARWRESSAYWVTKDDPAALKGLGVFLTVGLSDKLTLAENRQYDRLLTELAIPHLYREDSGGHDWPLWLRELPDHLAFLAGYLR